MTPDELTTHVRALADANPDRRLIVGLVGPPGAGKSTIARQLVETFGDNAVEVPMDAFHLANEILHRHGTHDRKGAPETFDGHGFVTLLTRLRSDDGHPVYAPRFHREIEESIAAEIEVLPTDRIIVTEGNYLLLDSQPWSAVRPLLDIAVYLELDNTIRLNRLIDRHIRFGKSPDEARAWATGSDERNAALIAASAQRADIHVQLADA